MTEPERPMSKLNLGSFFDAKGLLDGTLADMEALLGNGRQATGMLPPLMFQAIVRIWRELGLDDDIRLCGRQGLEVVIHGKPLSLDEVPK